MATGRVKWFNEGRGYGHIIPDDGGPDLFVHFREVVDEGPRTFRRRSASVLKSLRAANRGGIKQCPVRRIRV